MSASSFHIPCILPCAESVSRVILQAVDGAARDVWPLRFRRLSSPPDNACGAKPGDDHPAAALPIIDIATPRPSDPRDLYTFLGMDVGPDGLLAFYCQYTGGMHHRYDIFLNWKTGEGLGVSIKLANRSIASVLSPASSTLKTSTMSRFHAKQHAFVGDRYLLSAVFSFDCVEESESMEGACLWLWTLPSTGRTPHRMADFESITVRNI